MVDLLAACGEWRGEDFRFFGRFRTGIVGKVLWGLVWQFVPAYCLLLTA